MYFLATPHLLPKTAERNSAGKQKKASANFSGAKTRDAHFFGRQYLCFRLDRPAASRLTSLQSPIPSGCQYLLFRRQPADTLPAFFFTEQISASRQSAPSIPAPAGQYLPDIFLFHFYTSRRGQLINHQMLFCSFGFPNAKMRGAHFPVGRPLAPGLTDRHPSVFLLYRALHLSASTLLPFFHFQSSLPTSSRSLSPRHSLPPSCCRLPTRRPNAKRSFARGCSLQGCRGAGRRPAFFLFLFSSFSFSLFFPLLPHLPGAAASPRRLLFSFHFFLSFLFLFFLFSFLFFLSFFIFSTSSFLSIFVFIFLLFFCLPFLFFLLPLFFYFLSCLQSISYSPFLPVLFFFFYPPHSNLFTAHRQPPTGHPSFFLFSLLFLSHFYTPSPCSVCLPSVISFFLSSFFSFLHHHPHSLQLPSGSSKKKKKNRQKNHPGTGWPLGRKRAAGGKAEGGDGAPGWRDGEQEKKCIPRGKR